MPRYKMINETKVQFTAEEEAERDAQEKAWADGSKDRKLAEVRFIRDNKLQQTDWKVTSAKEQSTNLSTSFKNWRQSLRDIPTTYNTESKLDEVLARDSDGKLTHSVWSE